MELDDGTAHVGLDLHRGHGSDDAVAGHAVDDGLAGHLAVYGYGLGLLLVLIHEIAGHQPYHQDCDHYTYDERLSILLFHSDRLL